MAGCGDENAKLKKLLGRGDRQRRSCVAGFASLPTNADASVTGGCSFCCGVKARRLASTASIGSTGRKG
jgi:hypothetical protein